jgi:septal ring-binding cell division protein DamX
MATSDGAAEKIGVEGTAPPKAAADPAPTFAFSPPVIPLAPPKKRPSRAGRASLILIALALGYYGLSQRSHTTPGHPVALDNPPKPVARPAVAPAPPAAPVPAAAAPGEHASPEPSPPVAAAPVAPADAGGTGTAASPRTPAVPTVDHAETKEPIRPLALTSKPFSRRFDATRWTVQVGATKDLATASATRDQLTSQGLDVIVESALVNGESWQRILVGRYATRAEAERSIAKLGEDGTASTPPAP